VKLCLLVPGPPPGGDAVAELARRLAADHGVEVTFALCEYRPPVALPPRRGSPGSIAVEDALGANYDIAVATDWTTTAHLFAMRASRHAMLVGSFAHERMAQHDPDRIPAALAYDLPVDFLATGRWIADALATLRPDARCLLVRAGVDRELFAPGASAGTGGPLRVVADARRDGVRVRAAVAAATGALKVAYVQDADDGAARAAVLRGADVTLHLDDADGVLGLPLEGFCAGATTVVAAAGGYEEIVRDGANGFLVEPDDPAGAARQLDRLAADRELLARLRAAAADVAREWPSPQQAAADLRAALDELLATPPPEAARWPVRLMADAIAQAAVVGAEHRGREAALDADLGPVRTAWRSRRLAPVRRAVGPLIVGARERHARWRR
jgi:hypothetical protein